MVLILTGNRAGQVVTNPQYNETFKNTDSLEGAKKVIKDDIRYLEKELSTKKKQLDLIYEYEEKARYGLYGD